MSMLADVMSNVNQRMRDINTKWIIIIMKSATWFSENSEFNLDYVCVNDSAFKV